MVTHSLGYGANEFVGISIIARGSVDQFLTRWPYLQYLDGQTNGLFVYTADSTYADREINPQDSYFLPFISNTPGVGDSFWTTSLNMTNVDSYRNRVELVFTPRDVDGLVTSYLVNESTQPGECRTWEDVLGERFGMTGAGSLEIRGAELIISSRTSTPDPEGGSFGQGVPPFSPDQLLRIGTNPDQRVGGVVKSAQFRTNLGLCEVWGESATVRVTLYDDGGNELGKRLYDLRPYENRQINNVPKKIAGLTELENGVVKVEIRSGTGRVGGYLSIIDNDTGDSIFIPINQTPPTTGMTARHSP
jgi:hypothetical protein